MAPSTLDPGLQDLSPSVSKLRNGLEVTGALGENPATGCYFGLAHAGLPWLAHSVSPFLSESIPQQSHLTSCPAEAVYTSSQQVFMSFLFVSGSVFKIEGEGGPGKPLDKPVPNHIWLFSEHFFIPSTRLDVPQRCLSESPDWMCPLSLLFTYMMYTLFTHRCWPDTGQEARIAYVSVAAEESQALRKQSQPYAPGAGW